jgi:diaminopimelate decarboxylase
VTGFAYRCGRLMAEQVDLGCIADAVGTPAYVYSAGRLIANLHAYRNALAGLPIDICYAVKANANLAVLRTLVQAGAGMDVVSTGEARRAIVAGCEPDRIVFSGVGKTAEDLVFALQTGLHQINVESMAELEALSQAAVASGRTATVAFRVNPDVDARTHAKITTGKAENKFGIAIADAPGAFARAASLPGIRAVGIAMHLGSQLLDLAPYRIAYGRAAELVGALRAAGYGIDRVDLGGGIGIPYRGEAPPSLAGYAAIVRETLAGLGCRLTVEPGRSIAGDAGILLSRVIYRKPGRARSFLVLDAAMNDLIRPAMYDAWHDIVPVAEAAADATRYAIDVVGPVCETGDTFARGRMLPLLAAGDLVAFLGAGAYGAVMASSYNSRPLVPEVLVAGSGFAIVRKRPTFEETIDLESQPPWLS